MLHELARRITHAEPLGAGRCVSGWVAMATMFGSTALAAERTVSATGSGSTCSAAAPCALATGVAAATCGDDVQILAGTYVDVALEIRLDCTETSPLVLHGEDPATVIFTTAAENGAVFVYDGSWITVEGIGVESESLGMRVFGSGDGVTFRDLAITTGATGLSVAGGDQHTIERVSVQHADADTWDGWNDGSSCFSVGWDGLAMNDVSIVDSTCTDIWNFGNQKNVTGLTITDNHLENVHDHGISLYDCDDVAIERNRYLVTRTDLPGTWGGSFYDSYCSADVRVRNNTVALQGVQVSGLGLMPNLAPQCSDGAGSDHDANERHLWVNNLIASPWQDAFRGGESCGTPPCVEDSHNLFDLGGADLGWWDGTGYASLTAWQAVDADGDGELQCTGCLEASADFVDVASGDLHLSAGSAAIDAGDDSECALPVVVGHCDIGAYEYDEAAPPEDTGVPEDPDPPAAGCAISLKDPPHGSVFTAAPTFSWTGDCPAVRLELSTDDAFDTATTWVFGQFDRTEHSLARLWSTIDQNFADGGVWRVVGEDEDGLVTESEVRAFTASRVTGTAPVASTTGCSVALSSPVDGATVLVPRFAWEGDCDAYRLELSTDASFALSTTFAFGRLAGGTFRVPEAVWSHVGVELAAGGFWRVVGGGADGDHVSEVRAVSAP